MSNPLHIILTLLTFRPTAAQRCQDYWNGRAPFCHPGGCASDAYHWWGTVSGSGNGAQCWTGEKRLCQCVASGSLGACVPTLPPKESEHLNGLFTTCNNGCSAYVCSVKWVKFWKRGQEETRTLKVVHRRRKSFSVRVKVTKRSLLSTIQACPAKKPLNSLTALSRIHRLQHLQLHPQQTGSLQPP